MGDEKTGRGTSKDQHAFARADIVQHRDGWEVERIALAEDVWLALVDKVPMRDATWAGSPLATTLGVPVLVDRLLAPGDGYALLRNGQVRQLFGRRTTSAPPVKP